MLVTNLIEGHHLMKDIKKSKPEKKSNINLTAIESFIAIVILAALAFKGVQSLVDASEAIKTGLAVLVVLLLVKTAIKR